MAQKLCRGCGVLGEDSIITQRRQKVKGNTALFSGAIVAGGMNNLMRAAIEITGVKKP
jgi:hypothetical protein